MTQEVVVGVACHNCFSEAWFHLVSKMCAFGHVGLFGADCLQSLMGFGNVPKWEEGKERPGDISSLLSSRGNQRKWQWPMGELPKSH